MIASAAIFLSGAALNVLCWAVNKGMPVVGSVSSNARHHTATSVDKLPLLWDRINVGLAWISIGDVMIIAGGLTLIGLLIAALLE